VRAVVQRVSRAAIRVGDETVARLERGLLALVGVGRGDGPTAAAELGARVVTGRFQARMELELVNAGPVTILLDTDKRF